MKTYKITEAGIVLVSASVCMCAEFLRRLVLQNGDIWFWRLYIYTDGNYFYVLDSNDFCLNMSNSLEEIKCDMTAEKKTIVM